MVGLAAGELLIDGLEVNETLYDFEEYGIVTHPAALSKPQA